MSLLLAVQHPVPWQRRSLPQIVSPTFNCDGPGDRETYALSGVFYPNVAAIVGDCAETGPIIM